MGDAVTFTLEEIEADLARHSKDGRRYIADREQLRYLLERVRELEAKKPADGVGT